MTFLKLFLICTFKEPHLAETGQIWRKIFFKIELCGVHGVCFFQVWGETYFMTKQLLKNPNTPEYAQVLVVMCPKLNSDAALLSPPLTVPREETLNPSPQFKSIPPSVDQNKRGPVILPSQAKVGPWISLICFSDTKTAC